MFSIRADFEQAVIGDFLDGDRNLGYTGERGCPPAAFSGHEFIACTAGANHKGLDDAIGLNGIGELLEAFRLKDRTRL